MSSERTRKRRLSYCNARNGNGSSSNSDSGMAYKFQIQLPDGLTTRLTLHDPPERIQVTEFIGLIRKELERDSHGSGSNRREVRWNPQMYLEDVFGKKISSVVVFSRFAPNKCHLLILHEHIGDSVETYKNMWDLSPYTDILEELPAEYTFETALADLIDNSLQAVWLNANGERRFIGVTIEKDKIDIFDSGPGMDGTEDNSIAKWGSIRSSNHRVDKAISGEPPYLQPFFGMFGYGGPIAAMHLGRKTTVSSKSKQCPKVYVLHLSRDSVLKRSSSSGSTWKVDGGIRDALEDEKALSSHGSFTWVEISNLKIKCPDMHKLQCLLKDIYFPYIQLDEAGNSNKTVMPVEFLVNDVNLAEVSGGEMAIANLHSCNGPDFVLQLSFLLNVEEESATRTANARLKFVYFPIVEGQERIESMLKKLEKDGYDIKEQFENFSCVSIRRLGRLLPDARWKQLPLMDFKHRDRIEALSLKSCSRRVKCFIDTDAGFCPTLSKTDLAHQDPFTLALKNFGSKSISNDKASQDVSIVIYRNGKRLSISQLEKDYIEWVRQMHEWYDQEINCGDDEPTVILSPPGKRKLGITQDVIRVHKAIKRMGKSWKSGQKVKVLKGAIGTLKKSMYATLEYIIVEGLAGDAGGEARLICRPIEIPDDQGCKIADVNGENPTIEIHKSVSFPINLIDAGKIVVIDQDVFHSQLEKCMVEFPSISILTNEQHKEVGIDSVLSFEAPVIAGSSLPKELVAVIRHASDTSVSSPLLGQKSIMKVDSEMSLDIVQAREEDKELKHGKVIVTCKEKPTLRGGINGLYIFSLHDIQKLSKAGLYKFTFSASSEKFGCKQLEKILTVEPAKKSAKWKFCNSTPLSVRVGACLPSTSIICYDSFGNHVPLGSISQIKLSIYCENHVVAEIKTIKIEVPDGGSSFTIPDVRIESSKLDKIRQRSYNATIEVTSLDGLYSATTSCKVLPGSPDHVKLLRAQLEKYLVPGRVIDELVLEMFDSSGNHIEEGTEVTINVDNLSFQDNFGSLRKVNGDGCIDLSGLLKVDASYGSEACLSVSTEGKDIFQESFHVPGREIQAVTEVHVIQVPKIESERPRTPHRLYENCQLACSPMSCWSNEFLQAYLRHTQKLEEEVEQIGLKVGCLERSISGLLDKKTNLENEISILKANLGEPYNRHVSLLEGTKETIKQEIEQLCPGTMASVLVQLSKRTMPNFNLKNKLKADCNSLVALLATVTDPRLSRVLSKYLGEELMLSVVSSTEGSRSFVQYDSSGEINKNFGIYKVASILGINIDKPFSVIALDKIRPYVGDFKNGDAQKKLAIPNPHSPLHQTGPAGFVGYAVNLLNFATNKLGLRATLFYQLFSQLQVYETRHDMELAHDCIKEGAVSLDGAIMHWNGILSHADTQEPKVRFPVVVPLPSDEIAIDIITQIQKKMDLLGELEAAYQRVLQMYQAVLKEYKSKHENLQKVVQTKSLQHMNEYSSSKYTGQSLSLSPYTDRR